MQLPELTGGGLCTCIWTIILKAITIVGKVAAIPCSSSDKLDMTSAQVFKIQFCCSYKTTVIKFLNPVIRSKLKNNLGMVGLVCSIVLENWIMLISF